MKKFVLFLLFVSSAYGDSIVLIDFGANSSQNVMEHPLWQDVFMDTYTGYVDAGPGGVAIVAGSNGSYDYQGIGGDELPFSSGDSIMVWWYNNSDDTIEFTPLISFTDPDRAVSGIDGTWYEMSRVVLPPYTEGYSLFVFNSTTAGRYSLVNTCMNYDNPGTLVCDKIILSGVEKDTIPPSAPNNLHTVSVSPHSISIVFNSSNDNTNIVGYRIYRNSKYICSVLDTFYTDSTLQPLSYYMYYVKAYDFMGNLSQSSDTVIVRTDSGSMYMIKFLTFNDSTGNLYDGFDNWHYSSPAHNPVGYMETAGGFYSDPDSLGHVREFYPYYNPYNTDHMGWLRWGYVDIDTSVYVEGKGSLKFVATGGAYDSSGVVAYAGLEVRYKEQFDSLMSVGDTPYAEIDVPGDVEFYAFPDMNAGEITFPEASSCDRFSLWVYMPVTVNHSGVTRPNTTVSFYPFIDGGGDHYYHYVTNIGGKGWIHILFDAHPLHNNSGDSNPYAYYEAGGYDFPGDPESYFKYMTRFAIRVGTYSYSIPHSPSYVYLDELAFYRTGQPENDETVANIGIGYDEETRTFDIGFNDKYRGSECNALYEVRYAFHPITNGNYDSAKLCNVIQDTSVSFTYTTGVKGQILKPVPGYNQIWALLKLDPEDEDSLVPGRTIYFAVKDISNRTFPDRDPYDTSYVYVPELQREVRVIDLVKTIWYTIPQRSPSGIKAGSMGTGKFTRLIFTNKILIGKVKRGSIVTIYGITGRVVYKKYIREDGNFIIQTPSFPDGVYYYSVKDSYGNYKKRGAFILLK